MEFAFVLLAIVCAAQAKSLSFAILCFLGELFGLNLESTWSENQVEILHNLCLSSFVAIGVGLSI